jgi:hypothetical protein
LVLSRLSSSTNVVPKNAPTLRSMDLLASVSVNSTGSGQTPMKKPLTSTIRPSTDMRPIVYETLLGILDTSSPPTLFPGRCVKINEDDTTSSSRIFIKIMMQEMMEGMGLKTLAERFEDPEVKRGCEGMFPTDVPKNTRFTINYFTSIGLGVIMEGTREYLKVGVSLYFLSF